MKPTCFSYGKEDISRMPKRPERSNKGYFGRVLAICGSEGMSGAAYFAAKAAMRCGAGIVEIFTPRANLSVLATLIPEAIIRAYDPERLDRGALLDAIARADSIVIGCGIGILPSSREILGIVLRNSDKPTVIDADALNLIAKNSSFLKYVKGKIITPHIGEMSRLVGLSLDSILEDTRGVAHEFAKKYGTVCLLKDHNTVVSDGGELIYINKSGNSGMATAGSGDMLAGTIAAIAAQGRHSGMTNFDAACLGAYIHGAAGDAAAEKYGEYSMITSDMIDCLSDVLK